MSNVPQLITKEGILADIPAGRRVRIDPELIDEHSNSLAPDDVTLSTGFTVTGIVDDSTDPLHGCFYVQNVTDHTRTMAWTATYDFSKQHNPNTNKYPVQTTVGTRGESGGSAEGVNPVAIQGTAIGPNYTGATGEPTIEQVNNKIILASREGASCTITLPTMTADQEGMEVTVKDMLGGGFTVASAQNIDGAGTWVANGQQYEAVTLVYSSNGWVVKEHYHPTPILA